MLRHITFRLIICFNKDCVFHLHLSLWPVVAVVPMPFSFDGFINPGTEQPQTGSDTLSVWLKWETWVNDTLLMNYFLQWRNEWMTTGWMKVLKRKTRSKRISGKSIWVITQWWGNQPRSVFTFKESSQWKSGALIVCHPTFVCWCLRCTGIPVLLAGGDRWDRVFNYI